MATAPGGRLPDLEKKTQDIRVGAVKALPGGGEQALLVMPEEGLIFLQERVQTYRDEDTVNGNPRYKAEIEALEHFRLGRLEAFWTDERQPPEAGEEIWWECWCWPDRVDALLRSCERTHSHVSQQRLFFPNLTVLMVRATSGQMEQIVGSSFAVSELRRASDTPYFFVKDATEANLWVEELATRVQPPGREDVSVCLLDTGLNRAHPLLEAATDDDDCHTVDPAWGVADHAGHGTGMAGLTLYGNLAPLLASTSPLAVTHRLESVKILPPTPFPPNEPSNYASLT
ncbi:MAG TPA: S8 family serine peptidase, partial [Allosphingosinicella sp.]|nr:S8 family serine peptidase [Allosphingosinicella sp.]